MKQFDHGPSPLKSKLKNKEVTLGSWLTIAHQSVVEIMGTAGFDWLTIDGEHAAVHRESLLNLIGHIQGNGMEALVRVNKNEEVAIKSAMDAGANGVIVPMVKNLEEAEMAVNYCKYPLQGKRGVGLSRAQHYGIGFESYQKWLREESVLIVQVEHIDAVTNLREILSLEDVDGIIIGPYDLSSSMGLPGQFDHPDVLKAIAEIRSTTLEMGKSLGFHVIPTDHQEVEKKIQDGYNFLAFSLDFFFLGDLARSEMQKLKNK